MTRKSPQAAVALTVAAVLLSACSNSQPIIDYWPIESPGPPGTSSAPGARPPAGDGFFAVLRPGDDADLIRPFTTLTEAYAHATAVIEAEVTGVRPGRSWGESPETALRSLFVDLRPVRVLRGALQPDLPVSVEFGAVWAPDPLEPVVDRMNADLPGRGVWLLRAQNEPPAERKPGAPAPSPGADPGLYWIVHPNSGVFVQGETHVEAPSAQRNRVTPGAQAEAERFGTLAELADHAVRA